MTNSVTKRSFESPDETREAGSGRGEIVNLGSATFMRATLPAGWKWSKDVKPIAGTDSCRAEHIGLVLQGSLHVVQDDGSEMDVQAGDLYNIPPGHDAWVTSSDDYVGVDITGHEKWAR